MNTIPRSRTRVKPPTNQLGVRTRTRPGYPTATWLYPNQPKKSAETEGMDDGVTPLWRKHIAEGLPLTVSCIHTSSHSDWLPGVMAWQSGLYGYSLTGSLEAYHGAGPTWFPPSVDSVSLHEATAKAIAKVDNTPYEMLEDVGELVSTVRFLANPFTALVQIGRAFHKDVRRRMRLKGKRISRAAASAAVWLEYRFVVSPLLRSIDDIIDSIGKEFEFPARRRARARSLSESRYSEEYQYFGLRYERSYTVNQKVSAGIIYTVTNPAGEMRNIYGLRNKDVPVTIWQLVPLSFMIDRIINISDSIKGFMNLSDPDISFVTAFVSKKREDFITRKLIDLSGYDDLSISSGGRTDYSRSYTRAEWIPTYADAIPQVDLGGLVSSITKVTDLISLCVSLFGGSAIKRTRS